MQSCNHRLRNRILRILKVSKFHEFLGILKLSVLNFTKLKLSHSSAPTFNKLFVANTTLNFWLRFVFLLTTTCFYSGPCSFVLLISGLIFYKYYNYTNREAAHKRYILRKLFSLCEFENFSVSIVMR